MPGVMQQFFAIFMATVLLIGGAEPSAKNGGTAGGMDFRAVWVATVYNLDYPAEATAESQALKTQADEILDTCVKLGMNAVILQVRPSCDALYPSRIFPWSRYLTGASGQAPAGGFDPLAYWVEGAHARGLELHAWVNPFRVTKAGKEELEALSPSSPAVLHPEWVVEHKENYYLDPGIPEVRELVIQGAEELVQNYDLDGIHLDDYFYPGQDFDDAGTFAKYSGSAGLADWRRENVNTLVRELGERLHAVDPALSYGISPSGVWADKRSLPQGSSTTGGYESYFGAYADSRKWVREGWVDYICPQIYWPIGHKTMDYATVARWWADTVRGTGVKLYIGMADYQAGTGREGEAWYGTQDIQDQLALNRTLPEVTGEVHFRYQFLAGSPGLSGIYTQLYREQTIITG